MDERVCGCNAIGACGVCAGRCSLQLGGRHHRPGVLLPERGQWLHLPQKDAAHHHNLAVQGTPPPPLPLPLTSWPATSHHTPKAPFTTLQLKVGPLPFRYLSRHGRPTPKAPFTTLQLKVGPLPFRHLSDHATSTPPPFAPSQFRVCPPPPPFVVAQCTIVVSLSLSLFWADRVLRKARSTDSVLFSA